MKTAFLLTGLVLILVANLVMVYSSLSPRGMEGFTSYFLENAGGAGKQYKAIGSFDDVRVSTDNNVSSWRYTDPDEPLLGPEFVPGPDSLFIFRDNQAKPGCCSASYSSDMGCICTTPQQRKFINTRGGNRTMEDGV
uniref:Uncharacterized protein n=1 Tax=viral metagenome TaxID=1070528 RepID=A0A6C0K2S6_9ZZZZ